jgi:hypothetical protein
MARLAGVRPAAAGHREHYPVAGGGDASSGRWVLTRSCRFVLITAAALSSAGVGCASAECTETATCATESVDSSPADHTTTTEGGIPGGDAEAAADDASDTGNAPEGAIDATAVSDASDSGAATEGGDSGATADAGDAGNEEDAGSRCNPNAPDCSSPQCQQGFLCTAVAPAGWFGPVALFDQGGGPPAPTPAACSGTYDDDDFDGNANPTSPAASCGCTSASRPTTVIRPAPRPVRTRWPRGRAAASAASPPKSRRCPRPRGAARAKRRRRPTACRCQGGSELGADARRLARLRRGAARPRRCARTGPARRSSRPSASGRARIRIARRRLGTHYFTSTIRASSIPAGARWALATAMLPRG